VPVSSVPAETQGGAWMNPTQVPQASFDLYLPLIQR
jgi:hypothetical protein